MTQQSPYTAEVSRILGINTSLRTNESNGLSQLCGSTESQGYIYSPEMPQQQLEEFFKTNLQTYIQAAEIFSSEISAGGSYSIFPFWDQSDASLWLRHKFIKDLPFASKQAIHDIKQNTEIKELSCSCFKIKDQNRIGIKIYQKSEIGMMYMPYRYSPFDLHVCFDYGKYNVEAVLNCSIDSIAEWAKNDSKALQVFKQQDSVEGSIIFKAVTPGNLNRELNFFLNDLEIYGIVDSCT